MEKYKQLQAAKEKIKTIATKVVEAFQQTKEYNTVLFSWYFKGFELLRWYLVKHPTGVDLENLDLEDVNKEMATDKASQSVAPEGDAPSVLMHPQLMTMWLPMPEPTTFFFLFSVLGARCILGLFNSNSGTIFSF